MSVRQLASIAAFEVVCLVIFTSICFAQETKPFRVDSYIPEKFTDLEWRVDGSFGANGTSSGADHRSYSPNQDPYTSDENESSDQLRLSGGSTLRYTFLTQPRFFNCRISFEPRWVASTQNKGRESQYDTGEAQSLSIDSIRTENGEYTLHGSTQLTGGQYIAGDLFLQASATATLDYRSIYKNVKNDTSFDSYYSAVNNYRSQSTYSSHLDRTEDSKYYSIMSELTAGWGRLHVGEYAATALQIIEVLDKNGLLDQEPSYDQMTELTKKIYELRRMHSTDDRLRRIEALQEIIGFLQTEKLIGTLNARQGLLIQDVWDYYPRNKRMFGTQIVGGCGLFYTLRSRQWGSTMSEERLITRQFLDSGNVVDTLLSEFSSGYTYAHEKQDDDQSYLLVGVNHVRPLGTHWQLDLWGSGRVYLNNDNSDSPMMTSQAQTASSRLTANTNATTQTYSDHYAIEGNVSLDWLVDSRKSFTFGASWSLSNIVTHTTYQYYDSYLDSLMIYKGWYKNSIRNLGISSTFYYRMSVPTTLIVNLMLRNQRRTYDQDGQNTSEYSDWTYQVSCSLQHYLF